MSPVVGYLMQFLKFVPALLGFVAGNKTINPEMPGFLSGIIDKFSGVIAAVGVIYYLLGARAEVISLNYLELAAVVLVVNMALKISPPKV